MTPTFVWICYGTATVLGVLHLAALLVIADGVFHISHHRHIVGQLWMTYQMRERMRHEHAARTRREKRHL